MSFPASQQQLDQFNHFSNDSLFDETSKIDLNSFQFHDQLNNYTFSVGRKNGATFIRPATIDPSLVELKVGVLLPFHQSNNGWTRVMTMR